MGNPPIAGRDDALREGGPRRADGDREHQAGADGAKVYPAGDQSITRPIRMERTFSCRTRNVVTRLPIVATPPPATIVQACQ